ncbi:MAG TPA: MMPL family transporter [Candidatus Binataceae bacterium]|nr:MMPL family transporter [Candidatus Binataceae bacterium]
MNDPEAGGLGRLILNQRHWIGAILLVATALMAMAALKVRIATNFIDLFPSDHPYVKLYERYLHYGSAEKVVFVLHVRHGDIFNPDTLARLENIQDDTERLPRIDHDMVFSLASYMTSYASAVPGGIRWRNYIDPQVPETPKEIAHLRELVRVHRNEVRNLISPDDKSVAVVGTLLQSNAEDYTALFAAIQAIVKRYQNANNAIYVAGEPVVRGYGYHYFGVIKGIFCLSIGLMVLALYLCLRRAGSWWVPAVTGTFSALWGLGWVGLRGYDFDPLMLVVPLLLTARDISHGVQWQRRYYYLRGQLGDSTQACILTTNYMLPAGLLAIMADVAGIIFISFCGIPALEHIAQAGTVWLAASLTMVFVFQPVLMSYLPVREFVAPARTYPRVRELGYRLAHWGTEPGPGRAALILGALVFLVWGVVSGLRARVGYFAPGTPLYKATAKVNRDLVQVERNFPTDEGWAVAAVPNSSNPPALRINDLKVLRMQVALRDFLLNDPVVRDVQTLANDAIIPSQPLLYDGHPKFHGLPSGNRIVLYSVMMFMHGKARATLEQFSYRNTTCIRVILKDHTAASLDNLLRALGDFQRGYLAHHPDLRGLRLECLGGIAGLYAAANDVLFRLDMRNIFFVLACVFVFCTVAFRSFSAGLLFVGACILANFGAFVYLQLRHIGLTIDTVPVISLGIGLGVDYGIYTVSRLRDEVRGGMGLINAAILAKQSTGGTVLMVFAIMIGALVPWMFSPAQFHANMSLLLALLMLLNLIAGVVVVPAFITWLGVSFVTRGQARKARSAA